MAEDNKVRRCVDALIEISKTKELSMITVMDIIKEADVKRNTFYYYFGSVRDVIVTSYIEYPLTSIPKIKDVSQLVRAITEQLNIHRAFNIKVAQSKFNPVLIEAIYHWSYLCLDKINPSDTIQKLQFQAFGFSGLYVNTYAKYGNLNNADKNYQGLEEIFKTRKF